MRTLLALVIALSVGSANAAPGDAARASLERQLSAIEHVPGRAALCAGGPTVAATLREIAVHPASAPLARNRALSLLRYYPSAETARLLRAEILQLHGVRRGLGVFDLQSALSSYAAVAGRHAVALVRRFVDHPLVELRAAAAEALPLTRSPEARSILQARLLTERAASVRHTLRRQLRLLERGWPAHPR